MSLASPLSRRSSGAAERERALVLEEELALLRKEQAEAREVDLLLVGFDLREVGVVGEVGRQVLREPYFTSTPTSPPRSFEILGVARADRSSGRR